MRVIGFLSQVAARIKSPPYQRFAELDRTGEPAVLETLHRPSGGTPNFGSLYGQDVEPAGKYVVVGPPRGEGWEFETVAVSNPLVLPFGGGYQEQSNWKRVLTETYGGLTGRRLSAALRKDGFDAIVTYDKYGTCETVLLNAKRR